LAGSVVYSNPEVMHYIIPQYNFVSYPPVEKKSFDISEKLGDGKGRGE